MAVSTAPTDFLDLYTDLQNRMRQETGVTATRDIAKRMINLALLNMHVGNGEKFPWAERNAVLRTRPNYTTGTIAVNKGSTSVTGDSTLWQTDDDFSIDNVRAGGKIVFASQQDVYEVASTSGETTLTLTDNYADTTLAAGSAYEYFEDEYALASDFLRPIDAQQFSDGIPIELIGRTAFRRMFPRNHNPNRPQIGTIIDKTPLSGGTTLRRLLRLAPPPDSDFRIPYSYVTSNLVVSSAGAEQTSFSADADEPIVPLRYRHAITLHALTAMYRDRKDDARSQEVKAEYAEFLSRVEADNDIGSSRPRIAPRVRPYQIRARRPWRQSGSRYDTNGRFDRMEF